MRAGVSAKQRMIRLRLALADDYLSFRIACKSDGHAASFVSTTQSFNAATSMVWLTLNMLLSFTRYEREVTANRSFRGLSMCRNVNGFETELRGIPEGWAATEQMLFRPVVSSRSTLVWRHALGAFSSHDFPAHVFGLAMLNFLQQFLVALIGDNLLSYLACYRDFLPGSGLHELSLSR